MLGGPPLTDMVSSKQTRTARLWIVRALPLQIPLRILRLVSIALLIVRLESAAEADLDIMFQGDTDIVSVSVRSGRVRFFGFDPRQRTTRTRGELTRCWKMDFARRRSGSSGCPVLPPTC